MAASFNVAPATADGFEQGLLSVGINGSDGICRIFRASAGTVSIQSSTKRTGTYALRVQNTSATAAFLQSAGNNGGAGISRIWRFYIYFASLPDANNATVWGVMDAQGDPTSFGPGNAAIGLAVDLSTSKFKPWVADGDKSPGAITTTFGTVFGPVLTTGTWYEVDFTFSQSDNVGTTPTTYDFRCAVSLDSDGAPGSVNRQNIVGADNTAAGHDLMNPGSGPEVYGCWNGATAIGNKYNADIFYDDAVAQSITSSGAVKADFDTLLDSMFPIGPGAVYLLSPSADGTHNTPADFTDDLGNSPPASVFDRLDELPQDTSTISDYVFQSTLAAGAYLEVAMSDLPGTIAGTQKLQGFMSRLGVNRASGSASIRQRWRLFDTIAGVEGQSNAVIPTFDTTKWWPDWNGNLGALFSSGIFGSTPAPGSNFYPGVDMVNGLLARFGKQSVDTARYRHQDFCIEVGVGPPSAVQTAGWGIMLT